MPKNHEISLRVYHRDTDAGGIVHHVSYLRFAERGRAEYMRNHGDFVYGYIRTTGGIVVARHASIEYHRPVRLDDELRIVTSLVEIRTTSYVMESQMYCRNELATVVRMTLVFLDVNGKPAPISDEIKKQFA